MLDYEPLLTKNLIWEISQNKPTLIARDFELFGIPCDITYKILLARGVFKWLSVRRLLIKLKNVWKSKIIETQNKIPLVKNKPYDLGYARGYLKAMIECREDVRALCHSERWQCPDFDDKARKFLESLEKN